MNLKKIKDSMLSDQYAEAQISQNDVYDLYNTGKLRITIPGQVPLKDFIKSVKERINDLWGEYEVGVSWPDLRVSAVPEGDKLNVKLV